jgi:hypothetical protein
MVDAFQNNIKKIRIKPESLPPIIIKPSIPITAISPGSPAAGSVTYTGENRLQVGDVITIRGISVEGYNGTFVVTYATQSAFVVTNATTGAASTDNSEAYSVGKYYFRYRIISEDGSRRSAWTPVQTIDARDLTDVDANLNVVSDGTKFILSWTSPDIYMTQYDVYVSWNPDPDQSGAQYTPYSYVGRATGNSFVIDIPQEYQSEDGTKLAKFAIQLPTSPQTLNVPAQIYLSSTGVSTQITPVDGGTV